MECKRIVTKTKSTENLATTPLVVRNLLAVLFDCINALHREDIDIGFSYFVTEAPIFADEYLEYLIDNLLENAIKHNTSLNPRIWVCIQEENYGYEISISDNGPGIKGGMKEFFFNRQEDLVELDYIKLRIS
jgi:signal transduction histidine kinase